MPDYVAMYQKLFAAQAEAIDGLKEIVDRLILVQRQVEEMYISAPERVKLCRSTNHPYQEDGHRDESNYSV